MIQDSASGRPLPQIEFSERREPTVEMFRSERSISVSPYWTYVGTSLKHSAWLPAKAPARMQLSRVSGAPRARSALKRTSRLTACPAKSRTAVLMCLFDQSSCFPRFRLGTIPRISLRFGQVEPRTRDPCSIQASAGICGVKRKSPKWNRPGNLSRAAEPIQIRRALTLCAQKGGAGLRQAVDLLELMSSA